MSITTVYALDETNFEIWADEGVVRLRIDEGREFELALDQLGDLISALEMAADDAIDWIEDNEDSEEDESFDPDLADLLALPFQPPLLPEPIDFSHHRLAADHFTD